VIDPHLATSHASRVVARCTQDLGEAAALPGLPDELRARLVELVQVVAREAGVLEALAEDQVQLPPPDPPEQADPGHALGPHPARCYGLGASARRKQ
jgi:hypothetical protein